MIDSSDLLKNINSILSAQRENTVDYNAWPMDLLADYIQKKHHAYVEEKTPVLQRYLDKLCKVHGNQHPELFAIAGHFNESAKALAAHMKKEELVLFPYVRKLENAEKNNEAAPVAFFGTVTNPIQMMTHEHDIEGDRFRDIAELSDNYTPPADACNTYRVTYSLLKEFEQDLHVHIHLENNILFPRAINAERKLRESI
jgi:regulator of cell morphogenesis and NO signaling